MTDLGVRYLIVDDDDVDVMAIRRAFHRAGVPGALIVARDGFEALDYLRGTGGKNAISRPYLILLDLNMPRMNGFEFLRELRADPVHRDAIVFVVSSTKDVRQKVAAYGYNVAGYVVKSGQTEDFVELAQLLGMFQSQVDFP